MIFIEAKGSVGANYITYGTYIRVRRFFVMDDFERWRLIRNVFRKCRAHGQVTDSVMRQIKPGIKEHVYIVVKLVTSIPANGLAILREMPDV
jgi:hypothetical protein